MRTAMQLVGCPPTLMSDKDQLIQCVYASAATQRFDKAELHTLLETCRRNNSQKDVTGMLLFQNGSFFQVLEGPPDQVAGLFEKISGDPRHSHVIKILESGIAERSFAEWTMGHAAVTYTDLAKIDGLNDFFMEERQFCDIEAGRAQTLLDAFKDGKWRQRIG
jgi:Sensors of blue-light using FAD